jgi:iron complex outermembrane receptor protein
VAVISGQTISDSGFTVLGDALSNLPQALNTTNIQNTSGTLFNAGQSRVDLRALSSARTLVLVDGRRHLTGDFRTSAVDLNMIPASMIDEIEAISGGASAVYGSEAIAGVVNIKLRKEFRGLELDFLGGATSESDGEEGKISGIYGREWADGRGSLMFGGEWGHAKPIFQRDRDWAYPGIRRNTAVNPQTVIPASRSNVMPTATFQFLVPMGAPAASSSIALDRSAVLSNSADCRLATVAPTARTATCSTRRSSTSCRESSSASRGARTWTSISRTTSSCSATSRTPVVTGLRSSSRRSPTPPAVARCRCSSRATTPS